MRIKWNKIEKEWQNWSLFEMLEAQLDLFYSMICCADIPEIPELEDDGIRTVRESDVPMAPQYAFVNIADTDIMATVQCWEITVITKLEIFCKDWN